MVLRWDFHTNTLLSATEKKMNKNELSVPGCREGNTCAQGLHPGCANKFVISENLSPKSQSGK